MDEKLSILVSCYSAKKCFCGSLEMQHPKLFCNPVHGPLPPQPPQERKILKKMLLICLLMVAGSWVHLCFLAGEA